MQSTLGDLCTFDARDDGCFATHDPCFYILVLDVLCSSRLSFQVLVTRERHVLKICEYHQGVMIGATVLSLTHPLLYIHI